MTKQTSYYKALAAQKRQRERNLVLVNSPEYKAKQYAKKLEQIAKQRLKTVKPIKKKFANNKKHSKAEQDHIKKVVEIGCIVCLNEGHGYCPCEVHHVSSGGVGLRSSNFEIIGLCRSHHRNGGYGVAIHSGKKIFEELFGSELLLLGQVISILNNEGN